jgi:hypothetical protein
MTKSAFIIDAVETGITTVMTRDARNFSSYRLPNGGSFEIL